MARAEYGSAGPRPVVQLRFRTGLTGAQYVKAEGWRSASLPRCPNHLGGGCSLARHGTYTRKTPSGTHIARWYCPESHTTFSLLPDCLAARLPGTLAELEDAVATAERSPSVAAAAATLRPGRSEPPGAPRADHGTRLVARALRRLPPDHPRLPWPPRHRRGARLAARDGRPATAGVADAARIRPPGRDPWASRFAVPTTGGS